MGATLSSPQTRRDLCTVYLSARTTMSIEIRSTSPQVILYPSARCRMSRSPATSSHSAARCTFASGKFLLGYALAMPLSACTFAATLVVLMLSGCTAGPLRKTKEITGNELLGVADLSAAPGYSPEDGWQAGQPEFRCTEVDVAPHRCPPGYVCLSRPGWIFEGSLELYRGCFRRCSGLASGDGCLDQQACGTARDPAQTMWAQICGPVFCN